MQGDFSPGLEKTYLQGCAYFMRFPEIKIAW
jgi:hypothetical protein